MTRVALVTGGNQGLGFALVRRLLEALGREDVVYLTARSEDRGRAAVERIAEDGTSRPAFATLDVRDSGQVEAAFDRASAHNGGLDIVIHNAAARITPDAPALEQVRAFVETNNLGTTRVLRALRGRLNKSARVVVVASAFGTLQHIDPAHHAKFAGEHVTLDSLDEVMRSYISDVVAGNASAAGWPDWINVPSKIGQVAAVRVFAGQVEDSVLVNAACPGLVDTEASRPWFSDMSQAQSPAEAAEDVVWLATLGATTLEPHGELVQKRRVLPFVP